MESMDYGKAFTFPQQDPDWIKKLAILGIIILVSLLRSFLLIPLLGLIVVGGYTLEIVRRVILDQSPTLPEWSDFGGLLKNGLLVFVVGFVYFLPNLLFSTCAQLPTVLESIRTSVDAETAQMLQDALGPLSIFSACCGCLSFLYSIVVGMIYPAALGRLAVTNEVGAAFRFNEVIALVRAQPAVYLIVFLISAVVSVIATLIGFLLCGVGVAFTGAYATFVTAHLYGQAYRAASGARGSAPSTGMATA